MSLTISPYSQTLNLDGGDIRIYPGVHHISSEPLIVLETDNFTLDGVDYTRVYLEIDNNGESVQTRWGGIDNSPFIIDIKVDNHFRAALWQEGEELVRHLVPHAIDFTYTDIYTEFRNNEHKPAHKKRILEKEKELETLLEEIRLLKEEFSDN